MTYKCIWGGIGVLLLDLLIATGGFWLFWGGEYRPIMYIWWFRTITVGFVLGFLLMLGGLFVEWRQGVLEERLFLRETPSKRKH